MAHNIEEAKDFFGKPVHRGSWVVFQEKDYRNFTYGKIIDIAPKTVKILNPWAACSGTLQETRQGWYQVIVVDESIVPQKNKDLINDVNARRV
jgi:hypothetical protein